MKNKVSQRKFEKLSEYEMFDVDAFITFNIVDMNGEGKRLISPSPTEVR